MILEEFLLKYAGELQNPQAKGISEQLQSGSDIVVPSNSGINIQDIANLAIANGYSSVFSDGSSVVFSKDENNGVPISKESVYTVWQESQSSGEKVATENIDKENLMKINSRTFQITKESEEYKTFEETLTKIASSNGIDNVSSIVVSLDKENGVISFKEACGTIDKENPIPDPVNKNPQTLNTVQPEVK